MDVARKKSFTLEMREGMLIFSGFKHSEAKCPECEAKLWYGEFIAKSNNPLIGISVVVDTDHWCCAHCGYEKIVTTSTPE